jgi:hypothetical protein
MLWDARSGALRATLKSTANFDLVEAVGFSAYDTTVAAYTQRGVETWNLVTGQHQSLYPQNTDWLQLVSQLASYRWGSDITDGWFIGPNVLDDAREVYSAVPGLIDLVQFDYFAPSASLNATLFATTVNQGYTVLLLGAPTGNRAATSTAAAAINANGTPGSAFPTITPFTNPLSTAEISGHWAGTLSQYPGGLQRLYPFQMDLLQLGNTVTGTSRIDGDNGIFAVIQLTGTVEGNTFRFSESSIVAQRIVTGFWCLKNGTLFFSSGPSGDALIGV